LESLVPKIGEKLEVHEMNRVKILNALVELKQRQTALTPECAGLNSPGCRMRLSDVILLMTPIT
jgi:hypothetical protein